MKIILPIITALVAGIGVYVVLQQQGSRQPCETNDSLAVIAETVTKRYDDLSGDLSDRLDAFARTTASDQLFSLRLLAENDRFAPEVAGRAGQFMAPMGFNLLEIVDSAGVIISSGHFPASSGSDDSRKLAVLVETPAVIGDTIMGQPLVSLQAMTGFVIADIPFYVIGGIVIDDYLLARLAPRPGIRILFRQGTTVLGMRDIRSISEVSEGIIIINDSAYPAVRIDLPAAGAPEGDPVPHLIAIVEQ